MDACDEGTSIIIVDETNKPKKTIIIKKTKAKKRKKKTDKPTKTNKPTPQTPSPFCAFWWRACVRVRIQQTVVHAPRGGVRILPRHVSPVHVAGGAVQQEDGDVAGDGGAGGGGTGLSHQTVPLLFALAIEDIEGNFRHAHRCFVKLRRCRCFGVSCCLSAKGKENLLLLARSGTCVHDAVTSWSWVRECLNKGNEGYVPCLLAPSLLLLPRGAL